MPRYAMRVEYDGGPYSGWQRQKDLPTVQGVLEAALAKLQKTDPKVAAAGRTDAGVHALGQVAQADLERPWDPFRLSEALNYHMKPAPVAITACAEVPDDWHARFSAIRRRYLFRLVPRRAPMTTERGKVWQVPHVLDAEAMRTGAAHLIGHHDFTTFRSSICQAASPVKTLERLDIHEITRPDGFTELQFDVRARSFLHNQVRSFVGTLERVGAGSWTPEDVKTALEARNRAACGPVCPPGGLYLARVDYEDDPFAGVL
ncbi:tRNA pseudouridine(38-40) synthase TruA [Histidinibacterium aquaticum]|uniref:tRNA pseudouridine synthase A n=1 Tax=Histidinibacterium aquaticum TaxID=2613962 RepID=A0A5J5GII4_9RHOB|nr:tRNA pseudouridine(38-40) synthase TruA [Histidinibacterium aquaticum]KAA9008079.1 tRNA pseudouridine(38-40) synthase TruA [Histidinibacterium aquaticum]